MVGRLRLTFKVLIAALVLMPAALTAQDQGRFRVLVPYFEPLEGAKDNFGKDAAKELRELLGTLATHQPLSERDIKDEVKRFDMKIEDLNCIRTRQLASQISAQVALCATYTQNPDKSWNVTGVEFWDIGSNEAFAVSDITVQEKEDDVAAQHIFDEFDLYVQQIRAVGICADYAASQQWENALRNCDQALELNPEGVAIRHQRAVILYEMDRMDESLAELEAVLAVNGYHESALQRAGYISTIQGDKDQGRIYYERYLELNPANAAIRMNIAYELAKAGDPVGGMALIQVGLDVDPENVDLWEQFGSYAFNAAVEAEQLAAMDAQDAGGLSPAAQEYYRQAIDAYEKVFAGKGAETPVSHLRNIIAAYIQLDDLAAAVDVGGRVLQTHPQEDALWSIYADALQKSDRLDEAITALDRVREINPSYPNVALRQGNWLIDAGRIQDAVGVLKEAAAGNPQQAEQAARLIFNDAYQNGYQQKRYAYSIAGMTAAKEIPGVGAELMNQLNFWHGFSVYQQAFADQAPTTLASAQATLPRFRESIALLNQSGGYPASVNVNLAQLLDNANIYVEIQEAIIKRGR
jgi:tetratricopeptide (TPR) repeat protein